MANEIPRDQAAYHEAGHVVAAYLERRPWTQVSIVREGESLGHTAYRRWREGFNPHLGLTVRERRSFKAAIVMSLAGVEAQKQYADQLPPGDPSAADDIRNAFDLAQYLTDSAKEHRAFVTWLQIRAADLITVPGLAGGCGQGWNPWEL